MIFVSSKQSNQCLKWAGVGSLAIAMSACMSVKVEESMFIRPDSLVPYQIKAPFDAARLQQILPEARLQPEAVAVDKELQLQGLSVHQPNAKVTVLYFGGNRSHIDDAAPSLSRHVGHCPVNFTLFDYRGYGRTHGTPNVDNLRQDALRIFDDVRARTQGPLIVHGHSLGSFMAGYVAQQRKVDGLVLETTATNISEIVKERTPWYAKPFVRFEIVDSLLPIDNAQAVSQFRGPSLVITGEKDQTTPAPLGEKVYQSIPSVKKRHLLIEGAGHSGNLSRKEVQEAYCGFVRGL